MRIRFNVASIGLLALSIGVFACGGGAAEQSEPKTPSEPTPGGGTAAGPAPAGEAGGEKSETPKAEAGGPLEIQIEPRSGSQVAGTATFSEEADGVKVTIKLGNAPAGLKGA